MVRREISIRKQKWAVFLRKKHGNNNDALYQEKIRARRKLGLGFCRRLLIRRMRISIMRNQARDCRSPLRRIGRR